MYAIYKSFASLNKGCGGPWGCGGFSEHRCEAAAPTEPAGETQRPLIWVMEEWTCCRKAAKEGTELLKENISNEKTVLNQRGKAAAFSNYLS